MKLFKKTFFSLLTVATIFPIATVVSCGKTPDNSDKTAHKNGSELITQYNIEKTNVDHNEDGIKNFQFKGFVNSIDKLNHQNVANYGSDDTKTLPKAIYNSLIDIFNEVRGIPYQYKNIADDLGYTKDELINLIGIKPMAAVVISDNEFHIELFKDNAANKTVWDYVKESDTFQIEEVNTHLGIWMARVKFFEKSDSPSWEHGTSENSNYGITGYPLYYVNQDFAQNGVNKQIESPYQIYQITYDHNA